MIVRYVSAQPATKYYAWQVEVMLNNFVSVGINLNYVDIVCWKQDGIVPPEWSKLAQGYAARFFFYDDKRVTKYYVSSIRPNILKQHFKEHPYLAQDAIFYHDCDIVFTKQLIFGPFLYDNKWYGSDTRFYISHDYILSKGKDVLDKMCKIVGIKKSVVKKNELNCIGAQYLMKNIDWVFWENVERDSEMLFKEITDLNNEKLIIDRRTMPPGQARQSYHPLQIWCADMWAVLWNGWKMGVETVVHKDFEFAWATSHVREWEKCYIYHNAGATGLIKGMFFKSEYMEEYPYNKELDLDKEFASYNYWELIQDTAKKSVLL